MSETIAISTSKFIKTVKAKIDDRIFTVRKIGAGEQLDLSREIGKISEYQVQAFNLRGRYESAKDEDEKAEILKEIMKASEAIGAINDRIESIYCGLFDDGGDGSYTKRLVHSLGIENIQKVYDQIMGATDEKSA